MRFPDRITIGGNMPFAQSELAHYLSAMTDAEIAPDGYPIRVEADAGEDEGYRVRVTSEETVISGGSPRGAVYGAYALLKRLGAQFLAEDCRILPHVSDLPETAFSSRPDFAYRDVYWRGALDGAFTLQCGLNAARADITPQMGGRVRFYNYSHTFSDLVPPEQWFDSHPEYFSLVGGRRKKAHSQLCLTNPDVLALCIEGVRRWMRENPDCRIFSVAQNDWYGNCECDACRAVDAREGSAAGSLLYFVNAIADAVREEFPQNKLHTFAYLYSRKAPKTVRPRENVIVRLCSIECCRSHPIGGCDQAIGGIDVENNCAQAFADTREDFVQDLAQWSAIAPHLYLWDYTTNFSNYLLPFPNLTVLGENLRLFKRYGVEGVLEQGNYAPGKTSAFAALRIYLLGELLWDTQVDTGKLIRRFVRGYYGEAADAPVGECLAMLERAAQAHHMGIFDAPDAPYLEESVLEQADALLAQALAGAKEETHRLRLRRERLSLRYALVTRTPLDAPGRDAAIDAFAQELTALDVRELFERRDLAASIDCMKKSRYAKEREGVPYACYRL